MACPTRGKANIKLQIANIFFSLLIYHLGSNLLKLFYDTATCRTIYHDFVHQTIEIHFQISVLSILSIVVSFPSADFLGFKPYSSSQ